MYFVHVNIGIVFTVNSGQEMELGHLQCTIQYMTHSIGWNTFLIQTLNTIGPLALCG